MRLRPLLTVAFTIHAVMVAGNQIPRTSVLGAWIASATEPYMIATGSWQTWDMFEAAPSYHSHRVVLIARFLDGTVEEFPPLLPDLSGQTANVRDHTFFMRVTGPEYSHYLQGYGLNACEAVKARTGRLPASVALRQIVEILRPLRAIRADGVIALPRTLDSNAVLCEEAVGSE